VCDNRYHNEHQDRHHHFLAYKGYKIYRTILWDVLAFHSPEYVHRSTYMVA
jgi:hypothetical protein